MRTAVLCPYSAAMTGGANQLAVGRRVRTVDASHATGEIVEDFGTLAGTEVVVDSRLTVRARRWAVALDDGRLQFYDDHEIEPIDSGE